MAVPLYVGSSFASGTQGTSAGNVTIPEIVGVVAGDLLVVYVETANQAVATPADFTIAPSSPQSVGPVGAAGGTMLSVFYKFADGADTSTLVLDSGDHQIANKVAIRGVDSASPFNASSGDVTEPTTTFAYPGLTTTVDECLLLFIVGNDLRTLNIPAPSSSDIEDSLLRVTQRAFVGSAGTLVLSTATKASPGLISDIAYTDASSAATYITLALSPPLAPPSETTVTIESTTQDSISAINIELGSEASVVANTTDSVSSLPLTSFLTTTLTATTEDTTVSLVGIATASVNVSATAANTVAAINVLLTDATIVYIDATTEDSTSSVSLVSSSEVAIGSVTQDSTTNLQLSSESLVSITNTTESATSELLAGIFVETYVDTFTDDVASNLQVSVKSPTVILSNTQDSVSEVYIGSTITSVITSSTEDSVAEFIASLSIDSFIEANISDTTSLIVLSLNGSYIPSTLFTVVSKRFMIVDRVNYVAVVEADNRLIKVDKINNISIVKEH